MLGLLLIHTLTTQRGIMALMVLPTTIIMRQMVIKVMFRHFIKIFLMFMFRHIINLPMRLELGMTLGIIILKEYMRKQVLMLIFQLALGHLPLLVLGVWQVVPEPMVMHQQEPMLIQVRGLTAQQLQELLVNQAVVVV